MIRFAENLNKMITAGLGGAMEAPSTEVALGHRIRYMDASGAVATFETNAAALIRSLRVDMQPIQEGSGDPSPDNIRPITGRDSVTVERTGKNLFDKSAAVVGKWLNVSTGAEENASTNYALSDWISVKSSTTYSFTNPQSSRRWFYDTSKNPVSAISGNPFTPEQDGFIRITISVNTISLDTFMVAIGNTLPSSYAHYDGASVTVQLGQTVYGGTVDVTTGKLTVTHGEIASYNGEVLTGEWISDRDVYAAGTTPTIGAQVVYVLDTPQTIDLDPQQSTTLIGDNNVWSDAGNISLEYPYYEETEGY